MSRTTAPRGRIAVGICATLLLLGAARLARGDQHVEIPGGDRSSVAAGARAVPVAGVGSLLRLKREIGEESFEISLRLSRVDLRHAAGIETLIVPEPGRTLLDFSPFPAQLSEAAFRPKLLLVSLRLQAFAAYEYGRIATWGPICSGGRSSPTSAGLHHANWKDRDHVSSVDSTWIMPWTVNIDDRVGTALHEYGLPGRPASHCCIRLLGEDARWVYDWVDVRGTSGPGTPIVLFGAYRFDLSPPWKALPTDPEGATLGTEEVDEALRLLSAEEPRRVGRETW